MNKENCALKLVNEIILHYDARSKKHQTIHATFNLCTIIMLTSLLFCIMNYERIFIYIEVNAVFLFILQ